eukprot:m51a1_g9368 hypothetical protein (421) ;mRNA; f:187106-188733
MLQSPHFGPVGGGYAAAAQDHHQLLLPQAGIVPPLLSLPASQFGGLSLSLAPVQRAAAVAPVEFAPPGSPLCPCLGHSRLKDARKSPIAPEPEPEKQAASPAPLLNSSGGNLSLGRNLVPSAPHVPKASTPVRLGHNQILCRAPRDAGKRHVEQRAALTSQVSVLCNVQFELQPNEERVLMAIVAALRAIPKDTENVVILGPCHNATDTSAVSLTTFGAYSSALGVSYVDTQTCKELEDTDLFARLSFRQDLDEYTVEALLPYLQIICPKAKLVPVFLDARCPEKRAKACGKEIGRIAARRRTAIVITSDFPHWGEKYGCSEKDLLIGRGDAGVKASLNSLNASLLRVITSCEPSHVVRSPFRKHLCCPMALVAGFRAAKKAGWSLAASVTANAIVCRPDRTYQGHASVIFHDCTTSTFQ